MNNHSVAYDIVGDVHGHADEMKALFAVLGYERMGRGYRHPQRQVVFVGDFIDRGPEIAEVIEIVRSTVDAGDGFAVMGNHEYNAIAFHTVVPGKSAQFFRPHSPKNLKQHRATLDQLTGGSLLDDAIAWFKTLPGAIELNGIRVVHAAWRSKQIDAINEGCRSLGRFDTAFLMESERSGSELNLAIEDVLKGPELQLPDDLSIIDKGGQRRNTVRIKWYEKRAGQTFRQYHLGSDNVPNVAIPGGDEACPKPYSIDEPPVFIGHYWLTGTPIPMAPNVACTDYSVAKGGKLCAYRWDGERTLSPDKFVYVDAFN